MTDCLIIGFNDSSFEKYVHMVRAMGADSGAYRDLALAFINFEGKPYRSMDVLNHFYFQDKPAEAKRFHNADYLWPVITVLGSFLTKHGLTFDYLSFPHLEQEKLKEKLLRDDIETIAVTTTLYVSPQPILEIVSFIRQYNRRAKIIVGGPFISNQPKMTATDTMTELFRAVGADIYVTCQEGEFALVNIIKALKAGADLAQVDNIAYRKGDGYVFTKTSIESNPLEENAVRYELFGSEAIGQFVTTRTAKSCPFSCSFCGFPQRAGKYKYLNVDHVERELNAIRELGTVDTVTFIDDTFNVPKERFRELLRMMIRNNYGFKWNSFYRSDHGDERTIQLMAEAGCEGVFLGIESGSDKMLQLMTKTSRRKHYATAIPLLKKADISIYASFIIGYPGETEETVRESLSLIHETQPDFFRAQLWYCDPITPIWNRREEFGLKGSAFNWSHNTMDAQTACDIIDQIFLSVPQSDSIWMPQFGFEQWSVYYLQRKGMSMDQIKTFLRCFNAVIKQQMLDPGTSLIDPQLRKSLETSCRFDRSEIPDMRPVELLSAERYNAAESYWTREFIGAPAGGCSELMRDEMQDDATGTDEIVCELDQLLIDRMRAAFPRQLSTALLAAFSVLLTRLGGRDEAFTVAGLENGALPVRLPAAWDKSFAELVQTTQQKIDEAEEHRRFAFHLLTNPVRLRRLGCSQPVFDVGFSFAEHRDTLESLLDSYSSIQEQMDLILTVRPLDGTMRLHFTYARKWFRRDTIERIAAFMLNILSDVTERPQQSNEMEEHHVVESYAEEVFEF